MVNALRYAARWRFGELSNRNLASRGAFTEETLLTKTAVRPWGSKIGQIPVGIRWCRPHSRPCDHTSEVPRGTVFFHHGPQLQLHIHGPLSDTQSGQTARCGIAGLSGCILPPLKSHLNTSTYEPPGFIIVGSILVGQPKGGFIEAQRGALSQGMGGSKSDPLK